MRVLKKYLPQILISFLMLCSTLATATCADIGSFIGIGKELVRTFKHTICLHEIRPAHIARIEKNVLPRIMNKNFLGVEPPANWELLTHKIINECYPDGNLCIKRVQEKSAQCVMDNFPALMLLFAPWFYEHCDVINKTMINNWKIKKTEVIRLINEALNDPITPQALPLN